jgi:hypothetical protein
VQRAGNLVDRVGVERGDHRSGGTLVNSAILRRSPSERPVGAAEHDVRLDADLAQLLHRVLRRLGLHLAGRGDERHERQVDVADVVAAERDAHLPDRFEERQRFDVADGAADFDDRDLGSAVDAAPAAIQLLISSVMCGMTCTVPPR